MSILQQYRRTPSRRVVYRHAKRTLYRVLLKGWTGSRAALDRRIRVFLRNRDRGYLLKLVRRRAFALAVAAAVLPSMPAHASPPIELSDISLDADVGGFVINGIDAYDYAGSVVSDAGDVNGDGLADVIVGTFNADPGGTEDAGESYVVFGKADGTAVELSAVTSGMGGFVINGADADDFSGRSVSGAGDVNGDGLADLIVGAYGGDPGGDLTAGEGYVVFGKVNGTVVELSAVALGVGGFVINGIDADDKSSRSVSDAGDVNGDGLADLIIGASVATPGGVELAGESYVVFGKANGTAVELSAVASGVGGFVINGIDAYDQSGVSVSTAGDVNGDGLADLIVGARLANPGLNIPGGPSKAGQSYVVFGKADGTAVLLSAVASGAGGFAINGADASDYSGLSVSDAGDVNGDGLADLIVGAFGADPGGNSTAGESYVVFGKTDGTAVELSAVASGMGGFVISGIDESDWSGLSVSAAGDVNGDGLEDLIVGASRADPGGIDRAGESYVVFGKADGMAVQLSAVVSGMGGFVINGIAGIDFSGRDVSGAGDVNGDGLADFIVGAFGADPAELSMAGESYVVFSPETAPATATYRARARTGDGAGGTSVLEVDIGDSRLSVDYSDQDSAHNGSGGASLETVTLHRSSVGLSNMPVAPAEVFWEMVTDRVGWASVGIEFKYVDSELSLLGVAESDLSVYFASTASGPWVELATTRDVARNLLSINVGTPFSSGVFCIGASAAAVPLPTLWLDFAASGGADGSEGAPFNTMAAGLNGVAVGGTINIKGDTADSDTSEVFTGAQVMNQAMTIRAVNGTVTLGGSQARSAPDIPAARVRSGFVSSER